MQNKYIKNLILSLSLFLVLVASFFYIIKIINDNNENFLVYREELINAESLKREIQKINQNISSVLNQVNSLEKHFLKLGDVGLFLSELEKEGEVNGVKVEVVSVDDLLKDANYLNLKLKIIGTFNDINKFIFILEHYKYELEILSYRIQRTDLSNTNQFTLPEWRADIEVKVVSFIKN